MPTDIFVRTTENAHMRARGKKTYKCTECGYLTTTILEWCPKCTAGLESEGGGYEV